MNLVDLIRTANGNLFRSKLRTFLTISAIFVGALTLTLTFALGEGASQYLNRQLGNVSAPGVFYVTPHWEQSAGISNTNAGEYQPDSNQSLMMLRENDINVLKKISGVEYARADYTLQGEYLTRNNGKKFTARNVAQFNGMTLDLSAGRSLQASDKASVIVPEDFIEKLRFASAEEMINTTVTFAYKNIQDKIIETPLTIVGVMKKSLITQGNIYIDETFAAQMAKDQGQDQQFYAAVVKFKDGAAASEPQQKQAIDEAGSFQAVSIKEQVSSLTSIISAITAGLSLVGAIALFAASFGIINTLLMSVYERTQEIGLMKALGMRRGTVFSMFAIEAALVGFWGSVIAVGIGAITSAGLSQWASSSFLKDFEGFTLLVVSPLNALSVMGLIMLIAFLAGTLPALKASKLDPIAALRSE